MLGYHGDNFIWLDPYGVFPSKKPEVYGKTDAEVWERILQLAEPCNFYKFLWVNYDGDQAWERVQIRRLKDIVKRIPHVHLTIRVENYSLLNEIKRIDKLLAELLPDHSSRRAIELGNEPSEIEMELWMDWISGIAPLLSSDTISGGLSPWMRNYQEHLIKVDRLPITHLGIHAYKGKEPALPFSMHPKFFTEIGTTDGDVSWLRKYHNEQHHIFILDGKSNGEWPDSYILTNEIAVALKKSEEQERNDVAIRIDDRNMKPPWEESMNQGQGQSQGQSQDPRGIQIQNDVQGIKDDLTEAVPQPLCNAIISIFDHRLARILETAGQWRLSE